MFEFAVFTYGMLASFILSAAERNHRARRPHPPILRHLGYVIVGMSGAASLILSGVAIRALI